MAKSRAISEAEVAQHKTKEDCWVIVEGGVYDVTHYLVKHPGGVQLLLRCAGADATADFKAMFHSKRARAALVPLYVGHVVGQAAPQFLSPQSASSAPSMVSRGPYGLGGTSNTVTVPTRAPLQAAIQHFVVSKVVQESELCVRISVEAHRTARGIRVIPVQHVKLHLAAEEGEDAVRAYTPAHSSRDGKRLEFVVKRYEAPGGLMSRHVHALRPGDPVRISGPYGEFRFSSWTIRQKPASLLVCCIGTGVAPMVQLLGAIDKKYWSVGKRFYVHMLYGERTPEQRLFRGELAGLRASAGDDLNLQMAYSSQGKRVDAALLLNTCSMDKIQAFSLCAICGTDQFVEAIESVAKKFDIAIQSF